MSTVGIVLLDSLPLCSVSVSSVTTAKEDIKTHVKSPRKRNSVKSDRSNPNHVLKPRAFTALRRSIQQIRKEVQMQVELASKFFEAMSKPLLPPKKLSSFM
jgi:hypothetical protein